MGMRSEDDYEYTQDENITPSESSTQYMAGDGSYQHDMYEDPYTSDTYEKRLAKEQQIKVFLQIRPLFN